MSAKETNRLNQLWSELKRRKVFRVVTMYAATAFILLEVVDIVAPALLLPSWTVTLVVVLLAIGFPIAIILAWIFDITPEGVRKTDSIEVAKEQEFSAEPVRRKLRVSDVIIAVLVVVVGVLAYPRVFKSKASLRAMTRPVTVVNEFGEKETRRIFKKEYITKKLKVFPFKNETNDSTKNWIGFGIREALYEDFLQFNYMVINIRDVEVAYSFFFEENYHNLNEFKHLREQIKDANENNCPYFLTGTYQLKDEYYEITSHLYQTKSGTIEKEKTFKGKDLFNLIDSISLQTRIDMGVSQNILNSSPDLPIKDHMTNNLNVLCKYIEGLHDWDEGRTYLTIRQAIEMDTTFVLPLIHLSFYNLWYQISDVTARRDINHAMRHRDRLSEYRNIETKVLYYQILGEIEKATKLMEKNQKLHPYNSNLLDMLWDFYDNNGKSFKEVETAKQLNKLVPDNPKFQLNLARSYQLTGQFDKGLKTIKKLLEINPENIEALLQLGELYLNRNDYDAAEETYKNLILQYPEQEKFWSLMLDHIAFARTNTIDPDFMKQISGNYISDARRVTEIDYVLNNQFLITRATTQGGFFLHPVSDTEFVWVHNSYALIHSYITDKDGKIIKRIRKESKRVDPRTRPGLIFWKQDSLIVNAEKLLQTNRHQEALIAFQKAYDQNPEHYYLANYIQHLKFLQSPEYEKSIPVFDSYAGSYSRGEVVLKIFKENNQFIYRNTGLFDWELLPLKVDLFMFPDRYSKLIQIVRENNSIKGFKVINRNGRENFYEREVEKALANQN